MLERVLEQEPAIRHVLSQGRKSSHPVPTSQDIGVAENIVTAFCGAAASPPLCLPYSSWWRLPTPIEPRPTPPTSAFRGRPSASARRCGTGWRDRPRRPRRLRRQLVRPVLTRCNGRPSGWSASCRRRGEEALHIVCSKLDVPR